MFLFDLICFTLEKQLLSFFSFKNTTHHITSHHNISQTKKEGSHFIYNNGNKLNKEKQKNEGNLKIKRLQTTHTHLFLLQNYKKK
jgi:hypothetical protein